MPTTTPKKTRATTMPGSEVGRTRHNLYAQAYVRIKVAILKGFYLEAITIIESLISDRLESRLTHLQGQDFSFQTLGIIIKKSREIETDSRLRALVDQDLDNWRSSRNKAVHEMVKLTDGDTFQWEDRVKGLIPVAENGLALLRKIDNRYKSLKRKESQR